MNTQLENDLRNIDALLEIVKQQGVSFIKTLNERQTSSNFNVQLSGKLPEQGLGSMQAIELFNKKFECYLE